jgi:hypothetical protein
MIVLENFNQENCMSTYMSICFLINNVRSINVLLFKLQFLLTTESNNLVLIQMYHLGFRYCTTYTYGSCRYCNGYANKQNIKCMILSLECELLMGKKSAL